MKVSGKITKVLPLQEGTTQQGAQWRKQTIVVVEDDPKPHPLTPSPRGEGEAFGEVALDLFNDKIPRTPLAIGQHVDAYFGIRTREYNGKVYNDINVWRLRVQEV